jgi:hypothetical protein
MTLLIAGGCSYADPNYVMYKKFDIETWPSLLAKKLGYDLINTAQGGRGNRHIVNSVIDAVVENEERDIVVVVAWSELYRLSYIDDTNLDHPIFLFSDAEYQRRKGKSKGLGNYFDFIEPGRQYLIKSITKMQDKTNQTPAEKAAALNSKMVIQSFKNIWYLQDFCQRRNIKMYHMHSFDAFAYDRTLADEIYGKHDTYSEVDKNIKQNIYYQRVQADNYYAGSDYNLYDDIEKNDMFIVDGNTINWHPNQQGHEFIADRIDNFMQTGMRLSNNKTLHTYRGFIYD